MNKQASAKENTTYTMKNAKATGINRLKMIANAIEKGNRRNKHNIKQTQF